MHTSYKKSNFGAAFVFLPKAKKEALSAFYAFCRLMDDIADEPRENPREELAFWREETERVFAGTPATELGGALLKTTLRYPVKKEYFLSLIDGMEMDLNGASYETFEDLEKYIYRVAGVVGLAVIEIFGYKNEKTGAYALALANAVQMTNIIRDIFEDAAMGRFYLPAVDMLKFKVGKNDIINKNYAALKPLLAYEARRAESFYDEAAALLSAEDKRSMFAAGVMGRVYRAVLRKIEKRGFKFEEKIKLSRAEKIKAVLGL